jgi:LPXTG-site transpeptidase (sortase) family protein
MRKAIFVLSWLLLIGGGIFLWRGGSDYWQSVSSQKEEALQWENQNVEAASTDRSPVTQSATIRRAGITNAGTFSKGQSVAKLSIPRLKTILYVLEGTDDNDLKRGPGHLEGTVMPGSKGNCVIAGHRDTHFRVLKNIAKGDEILVQSRQGTYKYRVTGTSVVTPDNIDSLQPTSTGVLNLITCFPFDYVGSAPRRFIVHADLIQS